jgi:hypothetical protein
MKTSYGWRKVLARGRAVGSPHSDPEGHARKIRPEPYLANGNPAPGPKFDYKLHWFEP